VQFPHNVPFKHGLAVGFGIGALFAFLVYGTFDYPFKHLLVRFMIVIIVGLVIGSILLSIKTGLTDGKPVFSEGKDAFIYGFVLLFDVLSVLFGSLLP